MGFRKDAYATVWEIKEAKGAGIPVQISISRKNKQTDAYETDFSSLCMCYGKAKEKAEKLAPKTRIKLGDVDVSTAYNRETKEGRTYFKIYDFEMVDGASTSNAGAGKPAAQKFEEPDRDDDLPF